jgi:deazaflavin-dependent oxidoreductase (nitroreductase family)
MADLSTAPVRPWYRVKRWMYRTGRPNALARVLLRLDVAQYGSGRVPVKRVVVLEVRGRTSGRQVSVPVVVTEVDGQRYLVAMLGEQANWVRNVRAAGGRAVLHRGRREAVRLAEVDVADRAPILRRYLELAPGARPHFPIGRHAPLTDFERIAGRYPVFRVVPEPP